MSFEEIQTTWLDQNLQKVDLEFVVPDAAVLSELERTHTT